jgi:hemolysin III
MSFFSRWLETHITLHSNDSLKEERMNGITHALGAVLSLIGLIALQIRVIPLGNPAAVIGTAVFGISMILTYSSSSIYHFVKPSNLKRFLRILDHVNIYILIAGTYTPFCLVLPPERGIPLLYTVWAIVILGSVFKLVFWAKVKPLHTIIYLLMGWLIVFYVKDLKQVLPPQVGAWILGGGLSYTAGTLFYAAKKMPYYHAVWHLFVVAGSAFFYGGVYLYALPLM